VGFHNSKLVFKAKVEKRKNEIINRLNKTKREDFPDLQAEREQRDRKERNKKKEVLKDQKERERLVIEEKKKQEELLDYGRIMVEEQMVSNKGIKKTVQE